MITLAAVRSLDARTLSEVALALCGAGAIAVWVGLRFGRFLFRLAGMAVIVAGLLGLIFQNSLSRQTLAASPRFPTSTATSPSPPASPSPAAHRTKKPPKKPKKKPTRQPPPPSGGGGPFIPPPPKPPSQPPLPPIKGSPLPP